ncbi:hypothetical protein [Clostridium tetani]|uniref:hypothetical protein n=1 Tax=Clostridium tetani TaxID=1513 RepID=UPI003D15EB14
MATISASLRMFDQMTRPLQQVTQALNLTISAMDNMNNSANRDIRITNSLNTARGAIQRASVGLQELVNEQDRARNNQNRLNDSFNRGTSEANGLTSKLKNLVGAYLGFQAVKKGIDLTIGGAAKLEQQLITISGMLGNKDVGKAFFGELNKYANISVYGLKEFNTITRSFIQFTKNTDNLMKLNKTAEKLAFLDPTQGLEGAGFALKEALSGDFMSVRQRFGFGKADAEILKASKSMDDFINKFNKLLASKGATDKAMEEFNKSAVAQMNNLKSNVETAFSQSAKTGLETIKPLLSKINEGFKNGSYQSFFNGINTGLSLITNGIVEMIDIAQYVGNVFRDNWSSIGPVVYGIAGALGVYFLALLAVNGAIAVSNIIESISNGIKTISAARTTMQAGATFSATVAQHGLNAALLACPLTWIIGLTVGFIVALAAAIAFSDKFRTGFARAFQGVANACATAFGAVVQTIENVLNWIIDKINVLLRAVNRVTSKVSSLWGGNGTNFEIDKVNFGGFKDAGQNAIRDFGATGAQKIQNFSANNIKNSIKNAMGLNNVSNNQSKMPDMNAWNKAQGPGTLGMDDPNKKLKKGNKHLKNIDDKIDISNEHLEMLRDLAEQESIQNFVTLTPTVQVTTGDIKEEADINKIINKIESYMENELVNSAEGVYA